MDITSLPSSDKDVDIMALPSSDKDGDIVALPSSDKDVDIVALTSSDKYVGSVDLPSSSDQNTVNKVISQPRTAEACPDTRLVHLQDDRGKSHCILVHIGLQYYKSINDVTYIISTNVSHCYCCCYYWYSYVR